MLPNKNLMTQARQALRGRWGLAVGTYFTCGLILLIINFIPLAGSLACAMLVGAFSLGLATFGLAFARRDKEARLEMIFSGFNSYGRALLLSFLLWLFVALWTLLLVVPGIIAAIAYSQAFFIMAEDGSITAIEAIKKSRRMMYGYKWKYVCLYLRFIGWFILGVLSCGLGFLWINPYLRVSLVKFYEDVKADDLKRTMEQ